MSQGSRSFGRAGLAGAAGRPGQPGHSAPPAFESVAEYGGRLGDVTFWGPYVRAALARHGYPCGDIRAGFVGTFPVFLVDDVVVKLFGYFHSWQESYEAELAVNRLLLDHPEIRAPRLLGHGQLYAGADSWPCLVTERLGGIAWRDARLAASDRVRAALDLGRMIRQVHDLPVPAGPTNLVADWAAENRSGATGRHRSWGSLPGNLIDQIDGYLVEPRERCLVHADLTEDHLFVKDGLLIGVIDWGDAMVTDPYYELGALFFGAFTCDRALLRAFLEGYGWVVDAEFPRRAMSAVLLHEFNVLEEVGRRFRLEGVSTLDELATMLWVPG